MRRGAAGQLIIPSQGIYEENEDQQMPLGHRMQIGERVFHYTENGGSGLSAGTLLQSEVPSGDFTGLAVATVAAGQDELTVTLGSTAATQNEYRNGYLWADGGTNIGHVYKIKEHPAIAASAAGVFTLYDPLVEALTNGTETVSLVKCPYKDVIIHPSVPTAHVVGVAPIDVTADYYFWCQTWGPAAVLTEGTVVIANHAAVGDGTDGAVQAADTDIELIVGDVMRVEGSGEKSLIYLRLAS